MDSNFRYRGWKVLNLFPYERSCAHPPVVSFVQRLQPAQLSFIDLLDGVIRLGLWHVWVLLALGLRLSQLLIVTQESRRPVGEREHQSLGAIRRPYTTLLGLIFGFNLDLPARIDLIANRRELSDGELVVESRHLAILEAFAQTPIELRLQVPEAVREVGRLTDIDSVDIHETETVEVGREVRSHSGAIEIDFSQPILELPQECDHGSA